MWWHWFQWKMQRRLKRLVEFVYTLVRYTRNVSLDFDLLKLKWTSDVWSCYGDNSRRHILWFSRQVLFVLEACPAPHKWAFRAI
jgi:hypothetical protein